MDVSEGPSLKAELSRDLTLYHHVFFNLFHSAIAVSTASSLLNYYEKVLRWNNVLVQLNVRSGPGNQVALG